MPLIPAVKEAKVGGLLFETSLGQKKKKRKINRSKKGQGHDQVVEFLSSQHKTLNSNVSTPRASPTPQKRILRLCCIEFKQNT
jgi:hypothetical protein